jgi:hypothetical protein
VLRWLVRSMPLRPIAVTLLPDAGDPGFSYCARLNTHVRVEHAKPGPSRAHAAADARLTSSVRPPLRTSQPCMLASWSTAQPQR